ncbi:hypothetical protein Tco_0728999 [Tanacetum coccineum]|uniref:Uncharacterized protein n=1 Tax=Tanacetum coccineum TaxID=301880 RepID=A0ABQ4YR60_9ASTR
MQNTIWNFGTRQSENYVSLPKKETVRAGLATLGLVDEDKPSLSSTTLVDIGNIIFSDIVSKLQDGKKGRDHNVCYTRFLSLMFEKLLGENYTNDDLAHLKPYTISAASFKKPLASEVALTSHMLKVATVLNEPEKSLILPSEEVNADDTDDKEPSPLLQVADTQHAEVTVATADATQSLVAFESAEEQRNQLKTAEAEKLMDEYEKKKGADEVEYESHYDTKSEIKFVESFPVTTIPGSLFIDQDMMGDTADLSLQDQLMEEEVDSDLKSMPDDEVESVSGFEVAESTDEENDTAETKVKLTQSENTVDNILDEMTSLNASTDKPSDPLGPIQAELSSFTTKIEKLESSLAEKVADKLEESVPRMVADAFEERMADLLADTLKNILPQIIKDSIQQALPKFDQRVQETLKAQSVRKGVWKDLQIVKDSLSYYATQLDKGDVNLLELVNLMKDMVFLLDSAKVFEKAKAEGEKVFLKEDMRIKLAEEAKIAEEAKAVEKAKANAHGEPQPINTTFEPKNAKEAKRLVEYEAKRANMLEEYTYYINHRAAQLAIIKITHRINNSTKEASMRITRNNDPLNLSVYDKFVLKMLGFSKWLKIYALASKVKIAGLSTAEKKRKRTSEIIKEVFVSEDIVVDGMHRNLVPPPGVEGSRGLVISEPKSVIFFYNGNFDLVFQREEESHLATTAQLIRIHSAIQRNTPKGGVMFKNMELTIEARSDNCSLKYGRDFSKNGRALNTLYVHHGILDMSQLPPLRIQPRISIDRECSKEYMALLLLLLFVELTHQSADLISWST